MINYCLPCSFVRQIENEQVLRRGLPFGRLLTVLVSEFEVVACLSMSQHHAIKASVVFETSNDLKSKSVPIEFDQPLEVVCWARDPQVGACY